MTKARADDLTGLIVGAWAVVYFFVWPWLRWVRKEPRAHLVSTATAPFRLAWWCVRTPLLVVGWCLEAPFRVLHFVTHDPEFSAELWRYTRVALAVCAAVYLYQHC